MNFQLFHYGYGQVRIDTYLRGKKGSHNEELAIATKFSFVKEREGIKQTHTIAADWSPIFGGLAMNKLTN